MSPGVRRPRRARLPVPNRLLPQNAGDLGRDGGGARHRIVSHGDAEHGTAERIARRIDRETIGVAIREFVGAPAVLRHLRERVVHELEQLGHGSKASRDRTARAARRPQRIDVSAGLLQDRDVRVAESINRLLAVPDDEDGRAGCQAEPLTPGLHQERHELPLRAARILELVHQHVVVARLEAITALSELVHLTQQIQRALKDVREIEHRALVERAPVLRQGDREHPPDAARHHRVQVACERRDDTLDLRADLADARRDAAARRLATDSARSCTG